MAASESGSGQPERVERRTARVGETPNGGRVATLVLSGEQLAALGIAPDAETVEYAVECGELRVE